MRLSKCAATLRRYPVSKQRVRHVRSLGLVLPLYGDAQRPDARGRPRRHKIAANGHAGPARGVPAGSEKPQPDQQRHERDPEQRDHCGVDNRMT